MGRMFGRQKLHAGLQKEALLEIWERYKLKAIALGREDLIEKYIFSSEAGWRKIDKKVAPFVDEIDSIERELVQQN